MIQVTDLDPQPEATQWTAPQRTFEEIWAEYFAAHPEVLASWRHQNGYLPEDYEGRDVEVEG
ncbi:hypothetical protein [Streptomyces sp. cg35]|uniref:hypothetical protein n=1 Tax=Streptomyces sp. cg35 TaxID=3421650 RepID=UPI003D1785D7